MGLILEVGRINERPLFGGGGVLAMGNRVESQRREGDEVRVLFMI